MTASPRKAPRQKRAQATVDAILDAAAELLVDNGYDKTSTNKIAQRAGVSVGSLYQYFPNKEAITLALVERHTERMVALLQSSIQEFIDAPLEDGLRMYVRAMIEVHAQDTAFHRVLVQQVLHLGFEKLEGVEKRARELVKFILDKKRDGLIVDDTDTAAWVLVTTVETLVHRGFLAGRDKELIYDTVCTVALRYLFGEVR